MDQQQDIFIKDRPLGLLLGRAIVMLPFGIIVGVGILWIETMDELARRWKNRNKRPESAG